MKIILQANVSTKELLLEFEREIEVPFVFPGMRFDGITSKPDGEPDGGMTYTAKEVAWDFVNQCVLVFLGEQNFGDDCTDEEEACYGARMDFKEWSLVKKRLLSQIRPPTA